MDRLNASDEFDWLKCIKSAHIEIPVIPREWLEMAESGAAEAPRIPSPQQVERQPAMPATFVGQAGPLLDHKISEAVDLVRDLANKNLNIMGEADRMK